MNKKIKQETETSSPKTTQNTEKSVHHKKTAIEKTHAEVPAVIEEPTTPTPSMQTVGPSSPEAAPQEAAPQETTASQETENKERDLMAQETLVNKQLESLWSNGRTQLIGQFPLHTKH